MEKISEQLPYDAENLRSLQDRFSGIMQKIKSSRFTEFFTEVAKRRDYLRERYGEVEAYANFYALTKDHVDNSKVKFSEFPDEDSVSGFMDYLESKYL